MADVEVQGGEVVVKMSGLEKAEAFHGDLRVPLSSVVDARAVASAWPELRGIRAPGTGVPNVIAVGTRRGDFGRDFAVVHGTGPAVVVELQDAEYSRLVVTNDHAETVVTLIRRAAGLEAAEGPPSPPAGDPWT